MKNLQDAIVLRLKLAEVAIDLRDRGKLIRSDVEGKVAGYLKGQGLHGGCLR